MNVYDFDGTIYDGDCSVEFILFLTRRHLKFLKYYPKAFVSCIKYLFGVIDASKLKRSFFKMISDVDLEREVELFWDIKISKIKKWYLEQKEKSDLVISASPDFLVGEACRRLNINCLSSPVNLKTGEYIKNFYGDEKLRQFKKKYSGVKIRKFYSDSKTDIFLADIAEESYFFKKNKVIRWMIDKD